MLKVWFQDKQHDVVLHFITSGQLNYFHNTDISFPTQFVNIFNRISGSSKIKIGSSLLNFSHS